MIRTIKLSLGLVPALLLASCAGYHLGGNKPASLTAIHKIAVPMFQNSTLHPRGETLATSAVANALVQDGTYRISRLDDADAVLEGNLRSINYSMLRGSRLDSLYPEELVTTVTIDWKVLDARNPGRILTAGTSTGTSRFFASANLQTARNNALPDALERAGEALVSRLANGM